MEVWRRLGDEGVAVLAVRDNPRSDTAPARCVQAHGPGASRLRGPARRTTRRDTALPAIPDLPPTVSFLDLTDAYCDPQTCPPVVGNVLVYLDDNHLSATYVASMAPAVGRVLDRTIADPPGHPAPPWWTRTPDSPRLRFAGEPEGLT